MTDSTTTETHAAQFYDIVVIVGHIHNLLRMLYIDTPSDCLCDPVCILHVKVHMCVCVCAR